MREQAGEGRGLSRGGREKGGSGAPFLPPPFQPNTPPPSPSLPPHVSYLIPPLLTPPPLGRAAPIARRVCDDEFLITLLPIDLTTVAWAFATLQVPARPPPHPILPTGCGLSVRRRNGLPPPPTQHNRISKQ